MAVTAAQDAVSRVNGKSNGTSKRRSMEIGDCLDGDGSMPNGVDALAYVRLYLGMTFAEAASTASTVSSKEADGEHSGGCQACYLARHRWSLVPYPEGYRVTDTSTTVTANSTVPVTDRAPALAAICAGAAAIGDDDLPRGPQRSYRTRKKNTLGTRSKTRSRLRGPWTKKHESTACQLS